MNPSTSYETCKYQADGEFTCPVIVPPPPKTSTKEQKGK